MTSYQLVSLSFGIAVAFLLWLTRRRWLSFTCVGVFTIFFLLMNYIGVLLTIWGYEWQTLTRMADLLPLMTDAQLVNAVLMVNLGLLSVWCGILCCEKLFGTPEIYPNRCVMDVNADSVAGIKSTTFWRIGLLCLAAFFIVFNPLAGNFMAVAGQASAAEQLEYRLEATRGRTHYALTLLAYNFLPYIALVGLALYWSTRRAICLLFLPCALLGKFVYLHKEPLVVYLLHIGIAFSILTTRSDGSRSAIPWFKIAAVCVLVFATLPLLYMAVLGFESDDVTGEAISDLAIGSMERIAGRMSNSYFFFAHFFPENYPHHGLAFVKTFSDVFGTSYVAINKEIFFDIESADREQGSIASDNLVNLYGGFGFAGIVVGGFLQGFLLAWIDRWFSRRPYNLGWFVLYSFAVMLCITLNQAHIFGVILGYGGLVFVVLAYLMNTSEEDYEADEDESADEPITLPFVAARHRHSERHPHHSDRAADHTTDRACR